MKKKMTEKDKFNFLISSLEQLLGEMYDENDELLDQIEKLEKEVEELKNLLIRNNIKI